MISQSHLFVKSTISFSLNQLLLAGASHHIGPSSLVKAVSCSENCRLVKQRSTALNRKSIAEGVLGAQDHSPWPISLPRLCPANDPVVCICAAVVLLRRCRCLRCWSLSCWSLSGRSLCGWSLGCWSRSCRCRGCYLRLILVLAAQGEVESQETTGRADGLD